MTFTFTCTRLCSRVFSKVLSVIRAGNFLFGFQSKSISTQLADFCIKMNQFNSFLLLFFFYERKLWTFSILAASSRLLHVHKNKLLNKKNSSVWQIFLERLRRAVVSEITNRLMVFSFLNVFRLNTCNGSFYFYVVKLQKHSVVCWKWCSAARWEQHGVSAEFLNGLEV